MSLERLNLLFNEFENAVATNNITTIPSNCTVEFANRETAMKTSKTKQNDGFMDKIKKGVNAVFSKSKSQDASDPTIFEKPSLISKT